MAIDIQDAVFGIGEEANVNRHKMSELLKCLGLLVCSLSFAAGIAVVVLDFLMYRVTFGMVDLIPSALVVSLIIVPVGTVIGAVAFAMGVITATRTDKCPLAHINTTGTRRYLLKIID